MGPESTALLYAELVRAFQTHFGAFRDEEFPEILIHSLPIPDITESIAHEAKVRGMLIRSLRILEEAGVELVAFPCNSLNYFVDYLASSTQLPVLSIVEEASKEITERSPDEVLLLSTPTTFEKGLYERYLDGIRVVRPDGHEDVLRIIMRTLRGENPSGEFIKMLETTYSAYDHVVIGCTDLSILVQDYRDDRIIDALECLSTAIMRQSCATPEQD